MPKTIMLVNDNFIANFIMKQVINNVDENIRIYDFTDSLAVLRVLQDVNPTFIFLDINMPQVSGWQFLDQMVENNLHYKVGILTSSTSEKDRQRARSYPNVVRFLNKPLAPEEVATVLETA